MIDKERLERIELDATVDHVELDENTIIERVDWIREGDFEWLISTVKEQQNEIEHLLTVQQAYEGLKKSL